jgi:hypothetical protein
MKRPFGKLATFRKRALACSFSVYLLCFISLCFWYPLGPIWLHKDGAYRNKNGTLFTEAQYLRYKVLEGTTFASLASVLVLGFIDSRADRRRGA